MRVLVVDDSAVVRGLLVRALDTDPYITVAGTAMHGLAALEFMRKTPVDVVVLDVEMPVMDGVTALRAILKEFHNTQVIMASSMTYEGAETTIQALTIGAAECIAKPVAKNAADSIAQLSQQLLPLVKALGQHSTQTAAPEKPVLVTPTTTAAIPKILVVGASTGGPKALSSLVAGLPVDFDLPILITQHMPPMFTPMLAKHLEKDGGRPCCEATNGMLIERGKTYVAPGGFHMAIDRQDKRMVTVLNEEPPEHFCRPSVNFLYRSAAQWYGQSTLAVMLTGMGEDGIEGARELAAVGAPIIVQDKATSVVWGMPAAIANAGLADQTLPLDLIPNAIQRICRQAMAVK
ncbi:chemotaxis-specific protein-glutamate methyltransferase CheB [Symmachiella dynata]|uniref:chemotaxis-specific protein-glutamate methyltransferase CheB n=1 Tax=Symmachiella dynata TaxID=2527995 RepID=UPI0021BCF51D|nr:chemotaxis-specific protein-glutamate methyltransferase CheB [Symmachiella dynata]